MLTRPPSRPRMAILNPSPSAPIRCATGTRQPSKLTTAVGCDRQPIFFSGRPNAQARRALLDQDRADPAGPVAPGPAHDEVEVAGAGAGDEGLAAVEHVGAVAFRAARWCARTRRPSRSRARSGSSWRAARMAHRSGSHRRRCASSPKRSIIHATMLWIER